MQKELVELRNLINRTQVKYVDISILLAMMATRVDDLIMKNMGADAKPLEESWEEPPQQEPENAEKGKGRGRPKKDRPVQTPPEPQEPHFEVFSPKVEVKTPPIIENAPEPPETILKEQKPSIVERLLGKEASEKARIRALRMAELERELAELQK